MQVVSSSVLEVERDTEGGRVMVGLLVEEWRDGSEGV